MSKEKSIPIVINRMFTGDKYLNDSGNENIGHEIINLFRADDKNNYIYFCDSGKYNSSEYQLPKYSFQVRPAGEKLLEIINIARINAKAEIDAEAEIDVSKITYGEIELEKIFADNEKQEENKQRLETFVTFKASKVIKPLSPQYIAYAGHIGQIPDCLNCAFKVNEHLRNYITPSENDFIILDSFAQKAFTDTSNWTEVDDTVAVSQAGYKEPRVTPGDIYGISNLELPYSNAFKFFIEKYPQLLSGILGEVCSYFDTHPNYQITKIDREWNNIDILIEVDNELVIVIENKIFSDLNGKKENEITQLDKYERIITKEDKYNAYNKIFILLLPDHNNINIDNYTNWHKLFYSSVSSCLDEFVKTNNDEQLKDFAEMVSRHSDKDYNYSVMKRRFERALIKAKNSESK